LLIRWTVVYFAEVFVKQLFELIAGFTETNYFRAVAEQVLAVLVTTFDPVKNSPEFLKTTRRISEEKLAAKHRSTPMKLFSGITILQSNEYEM
jgi:hypothetical protein